MEREMQLLDVVALIEDMPAESLVRGQVGTVVEELDEGTVLVEFADPSGRSYAITPVPVDRLLRLRYEPWEPST